ncbi:MAG: adenine phosphoribosyltransferase [Microthrixaceae bacterium]|nr:adenine phosphoribosyltransferase [Acidimicrobiales bacterium]MCB9403566.1 adenine phosphoribosyltransferase [Microthrixaceae bacterium]
MNPIDLSAFIRDVPDFPSDGVLFKDITPMLASSAAFPVCIDGLAAAFEGERVDKVIGVEARGFILAAPVALRLRAGFVPVRKPGKLPWKTESREYSLEYGTDQLEIHRDGLNKGDRVVIIDDVLATGGTAGATARLVEDLGGTIVGFGFLMELAFLPGRDRISDYRISSLLTYA